MERITARIAALRETRGLSESQLAHATAIPLTTLRRRMVDPSTFTLAELDAVAAVLDVKPAHLWLGDAA